MGEKKRRSESTGIEGVVLLGIFTVLLGMVGLVQSSKPGKITDHHVFNYNGKKAVVKREDNMRNYGRWRDDRYWIQLEDGSVIEDGVLMSDSGKQIRINNGKYSIK